MAALSAAALPAAPSREAAPQGLSDDAAAALEAVVASEAPLRESDFPAALTLVAAAGTGAPEGQLKDLAAGLGLTWDRARFVIARSVASMSIITGAHSEAGVERLYNTRAAVPSPEELAVVRSHAGELERVAANLSDD
jgi:hypothetical protein